MMLLAWSMLMIAQTQPFVAKTASGSVVRLLAVSDDPARHAWKPDGTPTKPMVLPDSLSIPKPNKGDLAFLVEIEVKSPPVEAKGSPVIQWQPTMETFRPPGAHIPPLEYPFHLAPDKVGPKRWQIVRYEHVASNLSTTYFGMSIGDSAWKTMTRALFKKGKVEVPSRYIGAPASLNISGMRLKVVGFPVFIPQDAMREDFRVAAFDARHQELVETTTFNSPHGPYKTFNRPPEQVREVQIQTRPFSFVQFKNVHAYPNKPRR